MGRRAHGDGSLYQRESDGRWVACVDLGVDLAGVRRRKEFSAKTKKEASEKRAAWIKSGALARHKRVIEAATVAEVAKMWLDYLEDQGRKRATISGYRCMYTVHVASSFLAAIRVDLVVREHVERLYRDLAAKLSMRMRQAIHVVLNGTFKHAMERELIARSPMERIKRPGGSKQARVKPHHRVRVWTEEEVRKFLEVAKGTQYGPLFEVALGTGLRPGELYALRWGDIDLYRGTLSVRDTGRVRRRGHLRDAEDGAEPSHD